MHTKHISHVHEDKRAFECNICGTKYKEKQVLNKNLASVVHEKRQNSLNEERAKSTDNFTPLHIAVMYGLQKSAEILLENGANIDAQKRFKEYTPLMTAIQYDRLSMVKFLIQKGASLKKRNIKNMSPLEMALNAKKFNSALMIPYLSSE